MHPRRLASLSAALLVASLIFLSACTGEPDEPAVIDPGQDTDAGTDVDDDVDPGPAEGEYCAPCSDDDECDDGDCLELIDGERSCGIDCEPGDDDACPDDAYCALMDADEQRGQCVPTAGTCDDPCEELNCPADEYCNPTTGQCETHPRICDTGCTMDLECGNPERYRCMPTGAPDGETMCTTVCDPDAAGEDQNLQCPSDYVCLETEDLEGQGVCYPLDLTCTDRCQDVDCPGGHNCDPVTGDCVEAVAGACEAGCEIDAHCDGPDDRCLHLGMADESTCWQACTGREGCPDGYECSTLLGLTTSLCLPETQQCGPCSDADCYPEGICDPLTGDCMPHPEDCTVEGCDDGQLCEPASKRCIDIDQQCSGDSWAADCDNVITRCTSQTAGTDGVCATMCDDNDDCQGERTCESTQYGPLCLQPDFGGPDACGVTAEAGSDVGPPCGDDGDCSDRCVETGNVPGFCSTDCGDDADCPGDAICGPGPDGDSVCLPVQCHCAADPLLDDQLHDGWMAALDELGMTTCDLFIGTDRADQLDDFGELAAVDDAVADLLASPAGGFGRVQNLVDEFDDEPFSPWSLLTSSASVLDVDTGELTTPGGTPQLADAILELDSAAGGELTEDDLEDEFDGVPDEVQKLVAEITKLIADAYSARNEALDDAGIDESIRQELFDNAHRLFLDHNGQETLDIEDSDIREAVENFPVGQFARIGTDLSYGIDLMVRNLSSIDPEDLEGEEFAVHLETAAGAIVVGDTDDNTYDAEEDEQLAEPIALLLETGGDNEYRMPAATNLSVDNAVSILVDLDGADTYSYPHAEHEHDNDAIMTSDDAGRIDPEDAGDNGPYSLSETARQGVGRLGIGMLFDYGEGEDTYETLRFGQGAGVLGVGALFAMGDGDASFEAESFAQGVALRGVGLLYGEAGDNTYRIWHAGQGFGTGGGVGLLYDEEGDDTYTAVTGVDEQGAPVDDEILYHSPDDTGMANNSLAQGAAAGGDGIGAGVGILRDVTGDDTYTASSYAQGFGRDRGLGVLADADGNDSYDGRNSVQGTGRDASAGVLIDTGGDDEFNDNLTPQQLGQGAGARLGWGVFVLEDGQNSITYGQPGGADARDGGFGFALFDGGPNDHDNFGGGLARGLLTVDADADENAPLVEGFTAGIFVQAGGEDDTYEHPLDDVGENDSIWRQDDEDFDRAVGVGVDQ